MKARTSWAMVAAVLGVVGLAHGQPPPSSYMPVVITESLPRS